VDQQKLKKMFDYLTGEVYKGDLGAISAAFAVVFGRKDLTLAQRAVELGEAGVVRWIIPTGGVGKDSGDLTVPESLYLTDEMVRQGISRTSIFPETQARNGGENARFSLQVAVDRGILYLALDIVAVIHSTSARRLAATLDLEARKLGWFGKLVTISSGYQPDFSDPKDQKEIMGEMIRMADQAAQGWLTPDPALSSDEELIELLAYARANVAA
jgi:hypothetical protein